MIIKNGLGWWFARKGSSNQYRRKVYNTTTRVNDEAHYANDNFEWEIPEKKIF